MTPQRCIYISLQTTLQERMIRDCISFEKHNIKIYKEDLNNKSATLGEKGRAKSHLQWAKLKLNAYRNELARLKGMNRVVVPKPLEGYKGAGECSCGCWVIANYCPNCGRRILWGKMKQ